ncbi:serine/threonine-protein kinase, partial [Dokdonella sp.]|uniref:serine/threonine-protein kinase n=1 Tax=Dokdonella sp. TaxID=2291710 RepID=UPI002F410CB6
ADARDGVLDAGAPRALPDLLADGAPADRRAGAYRLLHPIGEGGMGVVWLGERGDGAFEQRVAVKVLKRGMDTHAILRRFLQERRILARLHHPHVVRLLDGGMSADGRPFYVMDHVDGEPLTGHASRHRLDVVARVALLAKVAEAVAYAHAQLVVHRDLKPSNVLVDASGEPRVLDFGIAKLLEESGEQTRTGTGLRVLSPAYAAPEQILGEAIGTATDVYALGLMLCELLVGRLPRRRSSAPAQLAQEATHETNERASTLAGRLTPADVDALYGAGVDAKRVAQALAGDLDIIVATALQRDPARRYPTAAAFADDLRRWLARRPITARADSASYRVARFVRRHRIGVAAAALVAVSLVAGLGIAIWQARVAREQAILAHAQAERAERVKELLVSIFQQNDPSLSKGEELSAAEILRRGRAALETTMTADDATRGELLMTIAEIQGNLGAWGEAVATAEQAHAMLVRSVAPTDDRLVYAYLVRGAIYNDADRNPEAERDFRSALAILEASPDPPPERVETLREKLAYVVNVTQSSEAAIALERTVVEAARRRLGDDAPAVADHRLALALMLEEGGLYDEGLREYAVALPILARARGAHDPRVCEAERNYAGLLDRVGRASDAEPLFSRALACYGKLYGADSRPYSRVVFSRGILRLGQQRLAEAEQDFRAALRAPDSDYMHAHGHRYLGRALEEQGRYAEALSELGEAERLYRVADMPHDIQRWRARADAGYVMFLLGDLDGSRAAVEAALAGIAAEKGDAAAPEYIRPLRAQGAIARASGDLATAMKAHRRWHELALALYDADSRDAWQSDYELALDLVASGEAASFAEAASLLERALPAARKDAAPELAGIERAQRDLARRMRPTAGDDDAS